jgi:hypothetical protein
LDEKYEVIRVSQGQPGFCRGWRRRRTLLGVTWAPLRLEEKKQTRRRVSKVA